jgi:streptogramin lyase
MRALLRFAFFIFCSGLLVAAEVATLAGTGVSGHSGDDGPAIEAQLGNPYGLTVGPDGALYVCEIDSHRVRRIDLVTGQISTVAGSGELGNSGDAGPATAALVNEPYEVRFDRSGDLYFVDMRSAVIRKVDMGSGVIAAVAGTGEPGFSGDGGPATDAQFNQPHSIAFDAQDNLYVADIGNNRIRRIDRTTGIMSTFAGTGERVTAPDGAPVHGAPLNGPRTMAFDQKGDMYLALREGNAVYRIDMQTHTLHHIAGTGEKGYEGDGGPAKLAKLAGPKGISVGPDGAVFIADTESHTIRLIDPKGIITTVIGTGERSASASISPLQSGLARPHGIYVDGDGIVYVGDSENHRIQVLR